MSFALSALLIVIILLPGAICIKTYYTSIKAKNTSIHVPLNDSLVNGIIISFIVHFIALTILGWLNFFPKITLLYITLVGKDLPVGDIDAVMLFKEFCIYNIVLYLLCFIGTKGFKYYVQINNLDIKYHTFNFTNYWYKIFSARGLEVPGVRGTLANTDIVFIDALIDNDIIYSGILIDYNYSDVNDKLENIVLNGAVKKICHQSPEDSLKKKIHILGDATEIPGNNFLIPADTIINLNISYIKAEFLDDALNGIRLTSAADKEEHKAVSTPALSEPTAAEL